MIERENRTIENMLATFVSKNQQDWDELMPLLKLAYKSAVHEATNVSFTEMVFGRTATLPLDLVLGRPDPKNMSRY